MMESTNQRLVAGLVQAHIPVTGFVIAGFVSPEATKQSGGTGQRSLQLWFDADFDLASHSDSHPNFAGKQLAVARLKSSSDVVLITDQAAKETH